MTIEALRRRASGRRAYTLIELMVVMGVIASLIVILALGVPAVRLMALKRAAASDMSMIELGVKSFEEEWGTIPPSGNSGLTAALLEGSRRAPWHARLVPDRIRKTTLLLGGTVDAVVTEVTVSNPQLLPTFPAADGTPSIRMFGAVRVGEEWIVFSGIDNNTLLDCRRGQFGTTAAEHGDGAEVVLLEYIDPWGMPYAYTRASDYGKVGTDQMLIGTGFEPCEQQISNCDSRSSQPEAGCYDYENCGRYQVVSAGENKKFRRNEQSDSTKDDDVRNW